MNSVSPSPLVTDLWLDAHGVAGTIGAATDLARHRSPTGDSEPANGAVYDPAGGSSRSLLCALRPRTANVSGSDYVIEGDLVKTM